MKIILKLFCMICGRETEHPFVKDDGIFEVYRCKFCGKEERYAVR